MALVDTWEVDLDDPKAVWQLMVGRDDEDPQETDRQLDVILDGIPRHEIGVGEGGRALEVGAGVGRLLKRLRDRKYFEFIRGVDSSLSMVFASDRYLGDPGAAGAEPGCDRWPGTILQNDGLYYPLPDTYFDFIFSFTCFQHMISLAMIHRNLSETYRVLKPGGICRIQTIISGNEDPHNTELFDGRVAKSPDEFASWFREANLEPESISVGLTHPSHVWITARKAA